MFGLFRRKATVRGVLRGEATKSPINRKRCVAFYYRSTHLRMNRGSGRIRVKLRDVWGYGSALVVEAPDGTLTPVSAQSVEPFTRAQHEALKAGGYEGFIAKERTVQSGTPVVIHGRWVGEGASRHLEFAPEDLSLQTPPKARP